MKIKFLKLEERQELIRLHKGTRDGRVRDRLKAILRLNQGWSYEKIAQALFLDDQTIRNYYKTYREIGIEGLTEFHYRGRNCCLSEEQSGDIKVHLDKITYLTADSIAVHIEDRYGVKYRRKGIVSLIKRLGFEYKKPKLMPGNPDATLQKEFVNEYQRIKQNLQVDDEVIFLDSVHPRHNVRNGYGRILKNRVKHLPTNSGRSRINIIGALNIGNLDVTVRQELTNVNSKSVANILLALLDKYPNAKNIHVILDNAGYNRAKIISVFKYTRIKLMFLPPYSPNLNLIERLWRFFHNKVTKFKHYQTFAQFQAACKNFFDNIEQHRNHLKTLLVENFNIIKPNLSKFLTA